MIITIHGTDGLFTAINNNTCLIESQTTELRQKRGLNKALTTALHSFFATTRSLHTKT